MDYGDKAPPPEHPPLVHAPAKSLRQGREGTRAQSGFEAEGPRVSPFVPVTPVTETYPTRDSGGAGASTLDDLTDVDTSGAVAGDVPTFDGSIWTPAAPAGGAPSGAAGGDLSGTYPNPSLGTSGVSAGTYGSAGKAAVLTIDSKGRVTSASEATISDGGPAHVSGGGGLAVYYLLGAVSNDSVIPGAVAANTLYAVPFIAPARGATLDRLAFNVTTLLAGNARAGLYDATSLTNLYPNALVVDGGGISTGTNGVKAATISQALTPGKLYWAVYLGDAAATVRCHQAGTGSNILGFDSTIPNGGNRGISVAQAYGALPGTFPAGAALITTGSTTPAVFGRYSA